jgi:hypothetical protein
MVEENVDQEKEMKVVEEEEEVMETQHLPSACAHRPPCLSAAVYGGVPSCRGAGRVRAPDAHRAVRAPARNIGTVHQGPP